MLTRRDIAETSIRTIGAFLTSVAIVGGGIGFFVNMASELKAQQNDVLSLDMAVRQLQKDVSALVAAQANYVTRDDLAGFATKDEIGPILDWVREQQLKTKPVSAQDSDDDSATSDPETQR